MKWVDRIKKNRTEWPKREWKPGEGKASELPPIVDSIIQHHVDAACFFDYKGDLQAYNERFVGLIGCKKTDKKMIDSTGAQIYRHFQQEKIKKGKSITQEEALFLQSGDCLSVIIIHIPIVIQGKVDGSLCLVRRKEEASAATQTEWNAVQYFRNVVNRMDVAVWSFDVSENEIIFVSDAIQEIYEIPADQITSETWGQLIHPDDLKGFQEKHAELLSKEKIVHSYRIITPSGKIKWVRDHTIAVKDDSGKALRLIGSLEDITESRELQQKLQGLAFIDKLTELPNSNYARRVWEEWKEKHQKAGQLFAVIRINLDRFNQINDVFGPYVGDEVLKRVARRLSDVVQANGLVFRLEGDDYLVFARQQKNETAGFIELVEKLQAAIMEPLPLNGYDFHMSASFGMSFFPTDGEEYVEQMKRSRRALLRAKQLGKGNYQMYSASMDIESYKSFQLESDLRRALKNHELFFVYQPKIDTVTQKAIGAEALIRWKHPSWGIVSPEEFIPIAESGEMIHQIGELVIETVCRQINEWEKEGVPFQFISFNLSAKNFLKRNLAERIQVYMDKYGISPHKLDIEVTEGDLLQNTEIVKEQLKTLKKLGVNIVLDDYGVGYSSIFYLKLYPVHKIKIDRSFINTVAENNEDAIIVKSIIDLSKGLHKKVVAEGVETREQFDLLKKMGCDIVQGFLFSRAVPPEEMKELFLKDELQPKKEGAKPKVERRRYFRVDLPLSLSTRMTIVSLNNKTVSLGSTEVVVDNIGPGGLRFISHLRVMPHAEILYGFSTKLLGTEIKQTGKIVWGEEVGKGIFRYGVEFKMNEQERDHLTALLNKVGSKMKSQSLFIDGNFVSETPTAYIRKHHR